MKNTGKKLKLNLSTVRVLTSNDLKTVAGGGNTDSNCSFCDGECTGRGIARRAN